MLYFLHNCGGDVLCITFFLFFFCLISAVKSMCLIMDSFSALKFELNYIICKCKAFSWECLFPALPAPLTTKSFLVMRWFKTLWWAVKLLKPELIPVSRICMWSLALRLLSESRVIDQACPVFILEVPLKFAAEFWPDILINDKNFCCQNNTVQYCIQREKSTWV